MAVVDFAGFGKISAGPGSTAHNQDSPTDASLEVSVLHHIGVVILSGVC